MSETETTDRAARFSEVLDRFSRLTSEGMQRFIGRLIGGGMDKPLVAAEIEHALQRLEGDVHLRKCWHGWERGSEHSAPDSKAGTN